MPRLIAAHKVHTSSIQAAINGAHVCHRSAEQFIPIALDESLATTLGVLQLMHDAGDELIPR